MESTKAAGLANAQLQIDVATFVQWVDAYSLEEAELADFYFERFRPSSRRPSTHGSPRGRSRTRRRRRRSRCPSTGSRSSSVACADSPTTHGPGESGRD